MTHPSPTTSPNGRDGPDRLYVLVPHLPVHAAMFLAQESVRMAQGNAPKLSGRSAQRLRPYYGSGFFGVRWLDPWVWYQEAGTRPRVMTNLQGKTIPMWVDDPTGSERAKNPKAEVRQTASGKTQVLIFRRAAKVGARKSVRRKVGGTYRMVDVPASFPGAPGRIARRHYAHYPGTHTGKVAARNIGVRWFNPGISGKGFIQHAIWTASQAAGYGTPEIQKG